MKTWLMVGLLITSAGFAKTSEKEVVPLKDEFDSCLEKQGLKSLEPKFTVFEIKSKREQCFLEIFGNKVKNPDIEN